MSIIKKIQQTKSNEVTISHSIKQISYDEHTLLLINHPTCQAAVSLQGAHLLYWQPATEHSPVIWLSEAALFKKQKAIRGGIPICWPWFGQGGDPMHGFARIVDWQLITHRERDEGVELVLRLQNNLQTEKYWSKTFTLELTLHLGKTCSVDLASTGNFEATTALHSYFGVNEIASVTVSGLGKTYLDRLANINNPKKEGEITFDQKVDRVYDQTENVTLITDNSRTIKLTHINHSDIVTWNPWIDKTKATADLLDDSYHHFVCVETCRINQPIKSNSRQKTSYGAVIEIVK